MAYLLKTKKSVVIEVSIDDRDEIERKQRALAYARRLGIPQGWKD